MKLWHWFKDLFNAERQQERAKRAHDELMAAAKKTEDALRESDPVFYGDSIIELSQIREESQAFQERLKNRGSSATSP
jgi:hypothetical protein